MTARFRRKFSRMRGSKSHGWGGKKKHRGGGSQGGKGMSGLLKHKKSWMIKYEPEHFGRTGFKLPQQVARKKAQEKTITLRDLDIIARKIEKTEIDLNAIGYKKIISSGRLTQPLTIKCRKITERAKNKIEESGGKVLLTDK